MRRLKKRIKRVSLITILFFLFQLFSPVFYDRLQAELYMSVSGKVVDKDTGKSIEKALVVIFKVENEQPTERFDYYETNREGRYIFDLVPPGEYWLFVHPPKDSDYALDLTPKKVKVVRGKNVLNVDFQLEIGGSISGTVYEADGVTAAKNLKFLFMTKESEMIEGATNSEGKYYLKGIPLSENTIIFVAFYGYKGMIKENISIIKGVTRENVDFILPPLENYVTGIVKSNLNGQNLQDAKIVFVGDKYIGITETDRVGRYSIYGLEEGAYKIYVRAPEHYRFIIERMEIRSGKDEHNFLLQHNTYQKGDCCDGDVECCDNIKTSQDTECDNTKNGCYAGCDRILVGIRYFCYAVCWGAAAFCYFDAYFDYYSCRLDVL